MDELHARTPVTEVIVGRAVYYATAPSYPLEPIAPVENESAAKATDEAVDKTANVQVVWGC